MAAEDTALQSNVVRLHEEFNRLRLAQDDAMRRAVYVGMSADDAKEFEKRRTRLIELFERLFVLKS